MIVNLNGSFQHQNDTCISIFNRGFLYGDGVFETIKTLGGKIVFWEEHYLRLMSSMRIVRMEIPTDFTLEFLETQIKETLKANNIQNKNARIRIDIYRKQGGLYTPQTRNISYIIKCIELTSPSIDTADHKYKYKIDIYKDYLISPDLLSTVKTTNRIINVLGSIYAKENELDNCLLMNTSKNIVELLNGNIFFIKNKEVFTPTISDGCINGIIRKQIIINLAKQTDYTVIERTISPFDVQSFDEIFMTNSIQNIVPISCYKKREFNTQATTTILKGFLENFIRDSTK